MVKAIQTCCWAIAPSAVLFCVSAWAEQGHVSRITKPLVVSTNVTCLGSGRWCSCWMTANRHFQLQLTITSMEHHTASIGVQHFPMATVFLFHGFGGKYILSAANYESYSHALALAGYIVVEYDIEGWGSILHDAVELTFLTQIYDSMKHGILAGLITLPETIMLAGHSRGGKLAALHFAEGTLPNTKNVFLIDPVDNPCFATESVCFPSARKALATHKRPVGVVGASIHGCCNPNMTTEGQPLACIFPCDGYGAEDLCMAAGEGSECHTLNAGHMQFAHLDILIESAADWLCGASNVSHSEVMQKTTQLMKSWFAKEELSLPTM